MTRAIVHKTKGKLDLRALTVFGMNAKPITETPIGYFGTGLKYAVAVLARHNIPVTFWIDGKKWTVEKVGTQFRDKGFESLYLMRHSMIRKTINLPFTTELGKNWELWQAFRELEANTRDEKGMTGTAEIFYDPDRPDYTKMGGHTYIEVKDERYVQCWMDRDKVFLPEGLSVRPDSDTRVQAFNRKSNHIYYRGIRILDLKEPSENTYNILSPITLTEDRTCKFRHEIDWAIEQFLQETENKEVMNRAIKAPAKSFEGRLTYDYITIHDGFVEEARKAGSEATRAIQTIVQSRTPKVRQTYTNWIRATIGALEGGDWDAFQEIVSGDHRDELLNILRNAAGEFEKEEINNSQDDEKARPQVMEECDGGA